MLAEINGKLKKLGLQLGFSSNFMVILSLLLIQEGHCQFLVKECTQVLVNRLED